jgi:3-oxoacyl-[acyl-carrier-protein] synthase-1
MKPISIIASGMVTAVGFSSQASCAAIRCAIDNFSETRFREEGGEWIIGSQVLLEQPWRGLPKLVHMAVPAIDECLAHVGSIRADQIALLLCVAEKGRPGRLQGLDDQLLEDIQAALGFQFHSKSVVIAKGKVGGGLAIDHARKLIYEEEVPLCIVAGVDSLLVTNSLVAFEKKERLLTSENSNGFIPGEAGAAVLVGPPNVRADLLCLGLGFGQEKATIYSEEPLRADGMVQAIKGAFSDAGCDINDLDFRITDSNGEQYWFKEATLALDRILRNRKELFEIWHPADCIGETGAAIGPCALAVALQARKRKYAFGRGPLCHFSADNSERVALVLAAGTKRGDQ